MMTTIIKDVMRPMVNAVVRQAVNAVCSFCDTTTTKG